MQKNEEPKPAILPTYKNSLKFQRYCFKTAEKLAGFFSM